MAKPTREMKSMKGILTRLYRILPRNDNPDEFGGWLQSLEETKWAKCIKNTIYIVGSGTALLWLTRLLQWEPLAKITGGTVDLTAIAIATYSFQAAIIVLLLVPLLRFSHRFHQRVPESSSRLERSASQQIEDAKIPRSLRRADEFLKWWKHVWVGWLTLYICFLLGAFTATPQFQRLWMKAGYSPSFRVTKPEKFLDGLTGTKKEPSFNREQQQILSTYASKAHPDHHTLADFNYFKDQDGKRPIDLDEAATVARDLYELANTRLDGDPQQKSRGAQFDQPKIGISRVLSVFKEFIEYRTIVGFEVLKDGISNLVSIYLLYCFFALLPPRRTSRNTEPVDWKGNHDIAILVFVLLLAMELVLVFSGLFPQDQTQEMFSWASGIFAAVSMVALVGRLESRWLGTPLWAILTLYVYVAIQPAYGAFAQYPSFAVIFPMAALVGKTLLYLIIFWLSDREILLFYLAKSGRGESAVVLQRADWLRQLRQHEVFVPDEIGEPIWLLEKLQSGVNPALKAGIALLPAATISKLEAVNPKNKTSAELKEFLCDLLNELCACEYVLGTTTPEKVGPGAPDTLASVNREALIAMCKDELEPNAMELGPHDRGAMMIAIANARAQLKHPPTGGHGMSPVAVQ